MSAEVSSGASGVDYKPRDAPRPEPARKDSTARQGSGKGAPLGDSGAPRWRGGGVECMSPGGMVAGTRGRADAAVGR